MSLSKVPYLVLGVICTRIAWTPPNPPVAKNEISVKEILVGGRAAQIKSIVPLALLTTEALAIGAKALSLNSPNPLLPEVLSILMLNGNVDDLQPSVPFYVGMVTLSIAAYFRWSCYRVLGRFFTYEVTVMKEHKLITTGPYSVVRHPSYTAFYAYMLGLLLMIWSRGSWLRESGFLDTVFGKASVSVSMYVWAYGLRMLTKRTAQEDLLLRQKFGKEWDDWAERVPWRLVPGIY